MSTLKYIVAGMALLIVGVLIGSSSGGQAGVEAALSEESPSATATIEPTPVATPTPRVVTETETIEVEVTPQSCKTALMWMLDDGVLAWGLIADIYADYVDYPDEDLTDFGRRVEERLTNADLGADYATVEDDVNACLES